MLLVLWAFFGGGGGSLFFFRKNFKKNHNGVHCWVMEPHVDDAIVSSKCMNIYLNFDCFIRVL